MPRRIEAGSVVGLLLDLDQSRLPTRYTLAGRLPKECQLVTRGALNRLFSVYVNRERCGIMASDMAGPFDWSAVVSPGCQMQVFSKQAPVATQDDFAEDGVR